MRRLSPYRIECELLLAARPALERSPARRGRLLPLLLSGQMLLPAGAAWATEPGPAAEESGHHATAPVQPPRPGFSLALASPSSAQPAALPSAVPSLAASLEPIAQATPVPGPVEQVTQPSASPQAVAPEPFAFRFESTPSTEFNSNVTQQAGGASDSILRLPISVTLGYRMPWGTQAFLGYQYQSWRYMNLKENNLSLHIGTLLLAHPLASFASVYGGYQAIDKVADNGTGITRFDQDLLAGLSLFAPLSNTSIVYGGYQYDSLVAEVNATSFNGHSLSLGYKQALLPALLFTGRYRFQHRQPTLGAVVPTNLHVLGLELEYRATSWLAATVRGDYTINSFTSSAANSFNYYTIGFGLNFGVDNQTLGGVRAQLPPPTAAPTEQPSLPPSVAPSIEPSVRPTPAPSAAPPARPTPPPRPARHVRIAPRGTLWHLAQQYYGDGRLWPRIARANGIRDPRKLRRGQALVVPPLPARQPLRRDRRVVRVAPGTTLTRLASRYYGDASQWRIIARANRLRNPDLIRQGQELVIPPLPSAPARPPGARRRAAERLLKLVPPPTVVPIELEHKLWKLSLPAYLKELARIYYGDKKYWKLIAKANDISDPVHDKVTRRLVIPARPRR